MKQALFIHHGAIGDFIVACRLMELCDNTWGKHRWTYLGKPAHGRLARTLQIIDASEDFERPGWHLLFTDHEAVPETIRSFLASFDVVLNVTCGGGTVFATRLSQLCSGRVVHIDPKLPEDYQGHVFEFMAGQVGGWGCVELPRTAFAVAPDVLDAVRQSGHDGLTLFHPGASSRAKRWPMAKFRAMMDEVARDGQQVGILLGEVELEQFPVGEIETLRSAGQVFFDWPMEKVAGLLALSKRYVGNDNGISHLAGAVGADTTVVFVRDNARQWHPLGPKVKTVLIPS